ncbi:MAG: hypothetical protein IJX34_01505 [Clostridia bacterium]|nr:hypothetical protein [Clostridia bacterium]
MAYSYPYFYSPSRRYSNYNYRYPNYYEQVYKSPTKDVIKQEEKENITHKQINSEGERNCEEEIRECFEIFGIKLFFDDILLICLIFFLYNEGVKDQYLFISLILLLLS